MKRRLIALLTAGHIVTDINQGALPALLPFLIVSHHLSYTAAASLIFAANISSSVIQPLFGYYADKVSVPWIMPAGMLLAGAGIAVTGLTSNYWLIFIAVALGGIGIAAYHPEAARRVNIVAGEKKATAVSTFSAGGNIGFAVGPIVTVGAATAFGMKGTALLFLPVAIVAVLFFARLSAFEVQMPSAAGSGQRVQELPADDWVSFSKLTAAVGCRSMLFFGLNTFLPLYWVHVLAQSKAAASTALTVLLLVGAVSTLVAGRLADRYGHRTIIITGFGALVPLLFFFVHADGIRWASLLLIPVGAALFAPFSPMVVLGQKYLPRRMGLASGVTLGLAVSIGGIFAPLLGLVADHWGLRAALECLTLLPVIAVAIAVALPVPKMDRPQTCPPDVPVPEAE